MDDARREAILAEAFRNIESRDANVRTLVEKQARNAQDPPGEDALTKWAAGMPKPEPPKRERGLDTDFASIIDAKIAAEREYWHAVIAETLALERRDVDDRLTRLEILERDLERRTVDADACAKLSEDARKLRGEIATLQNCITDLRATVASEAQRGVDLPSFRYPKDLN
jgi:hypothetical protein